VELFKFVNAARQDAALACAGKRSPTFSHFPPSKLVKASWAKRAAPRSRLFARHVERNAEALTVVIVIPIKAKGDAYFTR